MAATIAESVWRSGAAYHESLNGDLAKVGQDEQLGPLGPLIAGEADESRRRSVLVLIQNVKSTPAC